MALKLSDEVKKALIESSLTGTTAGYVPTTPTTGGTSWSPSTIAPTFITSTPSRVISEAEYDELTTELARLRAEKKLCALCSRNEEPGKFSKEPEEEFGKWE